MPETELKIFAVASAQPDITRLLSGLQSMLKMAAFSSSSSSSSSLPPLTAMDDGSYSLKIASH